MESRGGDDFAVVSIAVEHTGDEAVRPYAEAAGPAIPTLIDDLGVSVARFGFTVVPNGMLVDEAGTIRWLKHGGFSVDDPADVAAVARFAAGEDPEDAHGGIGGSEPAYVLEPTARELVAARIRLGQLLLEKGAREEAVAEWRGALRLDPGNFLVRKQIWAAEHPEKFFPEIDFDWQQERLREERAAEVAAGVCGPDGCPLPAAPRGV